MRKRLRDSLTAKIFLLTIFMLLMVSGITYACIAKFLPVIYRNELEESLQKKAEDLKGELERYQSIDEAKNFLEVFQGNEQTSVLLLNEGGEVLFSSDWIDGETIEGFSDEILDSWVQESVADEEYKEETDTVQAYEQDTATAVNSDLDAWKSYQVKIGDDTCTMIVRGSLQAVNQAEQVLRQTLPLIMTVIGCIALVCAFAASFFITRPIMSLSRISGKMAGLNFDERCRDNRSDELGVLARSLNELSDNLSAAMNDLKDANRKLKSDMEKEREEERKRTAFFAAASHELKTPVTILKGHLGGMLEKVGDYQNRDYYLERSYEVTETMEGMVQEILAVSRMESGAWEIKKERTDLAELVRLQTAELLELLENKKMELQVCVPEHLYIEVDSSMMVKVFRNLLVNAIRYSPEFADIRIWMYEINMKREDVQRKDMQETDTEKKETQEKEIQEIYTQDNNRTVMFSVENTGVHIPEESLPHLFDAFYRVEDSRNRKSGGSGLGLYIVRMILEQHGGFYGAENSRDGVRLWFRLPLKEYHIAYKKSKTHRNHIITPKEIQNGTVK